jgi:alpha-beta hydrolase superfamily lysophospholipase
MPGSVLTAAEIAPRPRFIAMGERVLFTWHHPPPPSLKRGGGIVICPPLGYEYMSTYRTLRILASRLAAIGFDVLRVDYDGTGNSTGNPDDPNRVAAWLGSIDCVMAETRRLSGSDRIALAGLRAGALLAVQAAVAAGGVERLVLWSPFSSGRRYVHELKAIAGLGEQRDADENTGGATVNAAGHIVTADTLAGLARLDTASVTTRPACQVLIVDRDDRPSDPAVGARFEALGSQVVRCRTSGTADMLLPPHLTKVPTQALGDIERWFGEWQVTRSTVSVQPPPIDDAGACELAGDGYAEQPVQFGQEDRLFGMFDCPAVPANGKPSIVLLNTGAGHNVGPHRLYVPLARNWAASGHAVLRFDLGGIGDSAAPPGARDGGAYPAHMLDDARDAIAWVRKKAPGRPVIVVGLCSGGWLAFKAAQRGLDVDAVVSINPPLYLLEGRSNWPGEHQQLQQCYQWLRHPSTWREAWRNIQSYPAGIRAIPHDLVRRLSIPFSTLLGDASVPALSGDLRAIARRGIRTLFVFSRGDNGLAYFQYWSPHALRGDSVSRYIQHVVVEDAGHAFRPRAAQRRLCALLTDFVAAFDDTPQP